MLGFTPAIFLALSLIAPTFLVKFLIAQLGIGISRFEKAFFAIFLGQIFLASFIFLLSLFFGLGWISIVTSLAIFSIADASILLLNKKAIKLNFRFNNNERLFLLVLAAIFVGLYILLARHMVPATPDGLSTPHNTFGDIQYHIAIMNSFYLGENFPPQNPIYPGVRLSYPFMIDFYSAVFRSTGFSVQLSLIIPGLVFGICFFAFFILFAHRFLKSKRGVLFSLLIFVFNGGLGGYLVLKESFSFSDFLSALPAEFVSTIDKYNFRFPNGVSSVFMAERPILVGMAALFAVLILLYLAFEKRNVIWELVLAGLIIGILPLWHTHTLIVLGIFLPFFFLAFWIYKRISFFRAVKFLLPILYLSLPLGFLGMLWHLSQVFGPGVHFFGFKTGWIVGPEGSLTFWLRNLGLFIPLSAIGLFLLNKKQKFFYIPCLFIFIASYFIKFQPFDWDNYKILLAWYAVSSIVVAKLISVLIETTFIGKITAVSLLTFFIISGSVLIIGDYMTFYGLFSNEDIELSNWEIVNTKPQDIILTGPQHNQFSLLSGRKILMGYQGYLWTQGIDSGKREADIRKMYHGDITLIRKYGVKYIVLGYSERASYSPDEKFLEKNFVLVKKTQNFKIYKVT